MHAIYDNQNKSGDNNNIIIEGEKENLHDTHVLNFPTKQTSITFFALIIHRAYHNLDSPQIANKGPISTQHTLRTIKRPVTIVTIRCAQVINLYMLGNHKSRR